MTQKKISGSLIFLFLILTQCKEPGNYMNQLDSLVPGASLIFKAKIILLHTVTTDEDDVTNAGVVTVTEVIDAPPSFQNLSGQQVTVRFSDINKVKVGEEKVFFTEPYWIGESIGVVEKGSIAKGDKLYDNKDITTYIRQARTKQDDEQIKKLLKDSKLAVTGRVTRIDIPEGYKRLATEHDPEWKEAEIQIDETLKGKADGKTVRVLFASTKDLMFEEAPKLKEGDEGIFIMQQTDSLTLKSVRNQNMLIEPGSFLRGKERVQHIKTLLK